MPLLAHAALKMNNDFLLHLIAYGANLNEEFVNNFNKEPVISRLMKNYREKAIPTIMLLLVNKISSPLVRSNLAGSVIADAVALRMNREMMDLLISYVPHESRDVLAGELYNYSLKARVHNVQEYLSSRFSQETLNKPLRMWGTVTNF